MTQASSANAQRVPILVYHHVYLESSPDLAAIDSTNGAGVIGEEAFVQQMQYLADQGWSIVSTSRVIDWLTEDKTIPEKSAVLHFDNGWLDTVTVALDLLRGFGFAATCFPITDGLEAATGRRSHQVRTLTEGVVEHPFMTWSDIAELVDAGWEIGAHTATHCKIAEMHDEQGDEGVIREAETSNDLFREHLGFAPDHFAYPSGSRNDASDRILSRYYKSLRLWHFDWPIRWSFTDRATSPLSIECQNIDVRVSFEDFKRIFIEAS